MKLKKSILLIGMSLMMAAGVVGCGGNKEEEPTEDVVDDVDVDEDDDTEAEAPGDQVLKVAALESGYGAEMWKEVTAAFQEANPGVTVELQTDKNIESVISPNMKAGEYPDVVLLAVSREDALTETLTKEKGLLNLMDVLEMEVPGEGVTVSQKLVPGFTDTLVTNPYADNETYLAPMFYSPCGLFYNEALLEEKGWEVPTTWDEMWELGEAAKAEGIALFTYPTAGYLDAFMYALLAETGGADFYNEAMMYSEEAWESDAAQEAFDIVAKLAEYTHETTVANANDDNFQKNQQLILDNQAIFMPNGTWVVEEMKEAPRAEGFKWGFTALPAAEEGGDGYSYTFFEQIWIPAAAENQDLAKEFVAYMYSDEAAAIFAKSGAIQPIEGISEMLEGENELFYSIYDTGAKAVMGGFAATEPVEGVNINDTLFQTVNSIITGDKTVAEWREAVIEDAAKLRDALQ
ncbi:MAG: carbohydrate ABC transporter substrate-binding protein [Epulopiscium sp.]|nr:carbohydrate ABC transporter substrate-binding protein [Candidatus Epulonipiscium sp.]